MWRCENLKSYYYNYIIIIMVVNMTPIKSLLSDSKSFLLFIFVGVRVCFVLFILLLVIITALVFGLFSC
jgi:hypothetical protein